MMDFVATFQHWLTLACFVALAVCLFALAVLCAIPELTDAIRRFCGMDNFSKVVCGVCIVGAVLYGGSKGVNVRWDDGLADNGTLITNDTVSVRWTYSGIPSASSVFIDYREAGSTNEWLNLAETLASAQEWTGTLANATNYDYWVYSTYVPPVPVHTNGVWVGQAYETKARVGAKSFLILNGLVQEHGRTIAPPKWAEPYVPTARDYIQDGLVAMWDGVENAGWGVHSANATVWKDLVGTNDAPLTISANLYFERDSLVGKNGKYAGYEGAYPIELSGDVTYEACWSRDTKFFESADSSAKFGFLALDVFSGKAFVKAGKTNRADYSVGVTQGQRFTLSLVGAYDTSAANLVAYCNGTRLTGGVIASGNYATPQLRFGSGWQNPSSHHFNIRLYSRALSADEIRHNHNIDKRRFNLP